MTQCRRSEAGRAAGGRADALAPRYAQPTTHSRAVGVRQIAIIELVRDLFLSRTREPSAYSAKPAEALEAFCARYLEALFYESSVKMLRASMAETAPLPEGAAKHHDVMFTEMAARIANYPQGDLQPELGHQRRGRSPTDRSNFVTRAVALVVRVRGPVVLDHHGRHVFRTDLSEEPNQVSNVVTSSAS